MLYLTQWYSVIFIVGHIVAPGYIDIQINGAFGVDFSTTEPPFTLEDVEVSELFAERTGKLSARPCLIFKRKGALQHCVVEYIHNTMKSLINYLLGDGNVFPNLYCIHLVIEYMTFLLVR